MGRDATLRLTLSRWHQFGSTFLALARPRSFDANGKCLAFWVNSGGFEASSSVLVLVRLHDVGIHVGWQNRSGEDCACRCKLQLSRENRRGVLVDGRAVCVGMAGVVQFTCTCTYVSDCAWREM